MATINHKKYDEATETFKDFYVYDGKETLIFKVDGEAGNVGIGTASPSTPLEVQGLLGIRLDEAGTGSNILTLRSDFAGTGPAVNVTTSSPLLLMTANTERMRITSAGDVAIGSTTTSGYRLYVVGDTWRNGTIHYTDGQSIFRTSGGASEIMRLTSAGNVGIGTTSPSTALAVNGAIQTTLGSGGVSLSGNASPDLGYIGYNYYNVSGTETVTQDVRNSWRIQFGNGANKNLNIGYRAPSAAASAFTERLSIDSSGNVGIGTASPTSKLEVVDANGIAIRIGDVSAAPASQSAAYVGVSTSGFTGANGDLVLIPRTSDARNVIFYTGSGTPSERFRVTDNGVTFNGDTAAANALDDYEEGTFTPTYAGGLTGVTYSTRYGSYTKIGNRVMFDLRIQATSVAGTSGSLVIGGLPFATNGAVISNATIGYFGVYTTDIVYCLIDTSAVDAILFYQKDATPLLGSELTADTSAIHLSGVYFV